MTPRASGDSSHAPVPATSPGWDIRPSGTRASRPDRHPRACRRSLRQCRRSVPRHVGVHPAGADRIHLHVVRRDFGGQRADEAVQRRPSRRCSPCSPGRRSARGSTRGSRGAEPPAPAPGARARRGSSGTSRSGWWRRCRRSDPPRRCPHWRRRFHCPRRARGSGRARPRRRRTPSPPCRDRGCRTRRHGWPSEQCRRLLEPAALAPDQRHGRSVAVESAGDRAPDSRASSCHHDVLRGHVHSRRSQFAAKTCGTGLDPAPRRSIDSTLRRARVPEDEASPGGCTRKRKAGRRGGRRLTGPANAWSTFLEHRAQTANRCCARWKKRKLQEMRSDRT